jgi:hypothetical protein
MRSFAIPENTAKIVTDILTTARAVQEQPDALSRSGGRRMTHEEVMQMLDETEIPYAYDHFAEGESPDPPFICFLFPGSENFAADNVVYMEFSNLSIEVYTDEKDPELEDRVEAVLNAHELFWNKSEVWIESEKLYEVLYQMTV